MPHISLPTSLLKIPNPQQLNLTFSYMDFLNHDQGLGELLMKPDPATYRFEPGYGLPRTITSPPASKGKPGGESGSRKRKADEAQKPKVVATEEDSKSCTGGSGSTITNNNNNKAPSNDPPKPDYIHVRARRGQATDSHSLAERVRREKISERMKYLQDLVPGCNRITGKAGMLDEIINYVQSLQRQVEFLSMKLASINPSPDFDVDGYLAKEMVASHAVNPATIQFNTLLGHGALDPSMDMDAILRRTITAPVSITDTFLEPSSLNQIQQVMPWEDELQNFYGMVYQQQRFTPFTGFNESGHVKLEM